jgi:hypothetical protein
MAPAEAATVLSLPEGCSMMVGEDGEEYVTLVQDGQTYAIPLAEYQNMQPGGTITIQVSTIDCLEVLTGIDILTRNFRIFDQVCQFL